VTPLAAYYLATPLFAALDLGLSARFPAQFRAAGVESPFVRLAYYAAVFVLGLVMKARPLLAPWLAMGESALNLTLLMASVLIPIWSLGETMDFAGVEDLPDRVLNLALSGSVLLYAFYRSQARSGVPRA
jgi:hypothetical protein